MAEYFFNHWQNLSLQSLVKTVLSDASLWDADLTLIPGFAETVTAKLLEIMQRGIMAVLQQENIKID